VVEAIRYAKEVGARVLVTTFRAKNSWVVAKYTNIVPTDPDHPDFKKYWREITRPKPADPRQLVDWYPYEPRGDNVKDALREAGWDIEKNIYGTGGTWWWPRRRELSPEIVREIGEDTEIEYCDLLHKGCPACRNCQKLTYPEAAGAPIIGLSDEPFCEHGCPQCFVRLGNSGVGGRKGISLGKNLKMAGFGERDIGNIYRNTVDIIQRVVRPAGAQRADYLSKFMGESGAGKIDMAISLFLDGKISHEDLEVIKREVGDHYGDIIDQLPIPDAKYSIRRVPAARPEAAAKEKRADVERLMPMGVDELAEVVSMPLSEIEVEVNYQHPSGNVVKVKQSAEEALREIDGQRDLVERVIKCMEG